MKQTLPIVGMACSACAAHVEKTLRSLDGVSSANVSLASRTAIVDYDPQQVTPDDMKASLNAIGFDMIVSSDESVETIEQREYVLLRRKTLLSWLLALLTMAVSMNMLHIGNRDAANQVCMMLALANIAYCGRTFYVNTWRRLRHGVTDMDTLVTFSTAITFIYSTFNTFFGDAFWGSRGIEWHTWFDASVMIITFVLTGRVLETKAKRGTAGAIRKLMGMQPKTARVVSAGHDGMEEYREVPMETIAIGDILELRPGEKAPVDGMVTMASSFMTDDAAYIDEAMITGEPAPVAKRRGDSVLAGTVLTQGNLRIRARQVGEHTALAAIIRMVQQAQGSKAPIQRTIDKVAMVFVPVVAAISVLTFIIWCAVGGMQALPQAILSAVAVLVIACPCAMGLATPTALMVGMGKAAQSQILIKDATALELLQRVDVVVTDKTGTLTIPNRQIDFTKADALPLEERETLKPFAREAVSELKDMGIDVHLTSGDKPEAVAFWAAKAGIGNFHAKVLPQDKEALVKALRQDGHCVAMVGDGINDTQALALADVGIAMGKGTDVAMDVAQVTLMGDDLRRIPEAILLSRRTVGMIRQNLFWAFVYNVVCIPLAAGVPFLFGISFQITPMWASAMMAFSSVSVVLNSLRLNFSGSTR